MLGILIFSAFSKPYQSIVQLIRNASLIQQVSFPRELLVANVSGFQFVRLLLSLIIVPIYMIDMGISFSWTLLLLPISIFGIILLAHGFSLMLCIIVVFVRDMNMVVDIGLRALFPFRCILFSNVHPSRISRLSSNESGCHIHRDLSRGSLGDIFQSSLQLSSSEQLE